MKKEENGQFPDKTSCDNQGSPPWRAEETPLGQLLCCAEDIERSTKHCSERERQRIESESLVLWAKDQNLLRDWDGFRELTPLTEELPGGAEHQVWAHLRGNYHRVFKVTRPPNFGARGRALAYVQNALWCNYLFEDDIILEGICELELGPAIIISQPYILGRRPTQQEIDEWCEMGGYLKISDLCWEHPKKGTRIADTHEGNFKVMDSGVMVPIDLQVLRLGNG